MKKIMVLILGLSFLFSAKALAEEKWKGLDEAVIEKVAEEKGRAPKPLIELEGDTELFAFALLSGLSGFVAGYYWRKLLSEGKRA
ncbi:hypothetical protein THC_0750 [Caldimicrobium thiodismutans]|jgi:hypothetical protein|uniref:Cobalt transporter n=1 Tax=Caldimicrobium thiodismutans TaxID=1653476 RepID=A0A0U5BWV2_9BACT|nr:hypothetical protein [Caldimicrobium thiodismutans]BAU23141.1 hypothetical protein THC_0750 [Caldimicrobium thiodismutans]